jgi:hypothetical protein
LQYTRIFFDPGASFLIDRPTGDLNDLWDASMWHNPTKNGISAIAVARRDEPRKDNTVKI